MTDEEKKHDIGDEIDALIDTVPDEAWDNAPSNFAATIDERLYGGGGVNNAVREALERARGAEMTLTRVAYNNGEGRGLMSEAREVLHRELMDAAQAAFTACLNELGFTVVRKAHTNMPCIHQCKLCGKNIDPKVYQIWIHDDGVSCFRDCENPVKVRVAHD